MTSSLKVFSNNDFSVRAVQDEDGKFWFVAKDIAEALDYSEATISNMEKTIAHVPDIWKGRERIPTTSDKATARPYQDMLCLTEEGLYFFLGRSDKPKALPYQMWIAGDVVPSIRQTGSYGIPQEKLEYLRITEMQIKSQNRTNDLEAARMLQNMINAPAFPITDESKTILAHEVVKLLTGSECLSMLPEVTEKGYSATEIGNIFGVSANKIGRVAISHGIKPPEGSSNEFGTWRVSKSKYSSHECPTFIYNNNALDWFRENAELFD